MRELTAAIDAGSPVVLATVIETSRSVPRHSGSKMLVFADGRISGSIGGGEMEHRVVEEAQGLLSGGASRLLSYDLVDPGRGDPGVCGGTVSLYLEAYMPTPTLFIVGCGHIGRAVSELAHWMGFRVIAYDDRTELATEEAIPRADLVFSGDFSAALAEAPITDNTHVVVVSRNTEVDLAVLPELIASRARSLGVMGSERRWRATRTELENRGMDPEDLDRVHAPIGLELNAETPEEIALSIISEIVMHRRGGGGEPMSDAVS